MKRVYIIAILFVAIVVLSYGIMKFLASQKELPKQVPSKEVVRYVETDDVVYSEINTEVPGKGRVFSLASVDLVSEGSGKIEQGDVPLKMGQSFRRGDVLFSIYKDEVELNLKALKSNFLNQIANLLPDIKIDYPDHYGAFSDFFNAIEMDEDLPELPETKSEQLKLFLASQNIMSQYYTIQKNEKAVDRYTVVAPFDGAYIVVNMEVGAYTNTGGRVAKAIRTDLVEVEVAVDVTDAHFIRIGDPVSLIGEESWTGKVSRISGHVDEGTQSRLIYVLMDKNGSMPIPGQYLQASFRGKTLEEVMEIPRSAIFNFNEIYTINDGRLKKMAVNIIKRNENTVIFNGPEEGTVVVTEALIGVRDGSKVSRLRDAPKNNDENITDANQQKQ